eukprot:Phypoly_transcript_00804.p1 GENE.Phypoly_transcript_00804~~Phypoly_transcript_00804.p1  ORF type:complete len:1167 (+),score=243.05 Phypoly_transcript_00804:427-3927(+)
MNKKPEWSNNLKTAGVDDMTLLSKVTNEQILDNLKKRYEANIIYTSIGDVLISVNPFKMLPIYSSDVLEEYIGRSRIELAPHVYGVAEAAYRAMLNEKENQCVIISGESGAGKTEAAKKIMQYIAEVSGQGSAGVERVKHIILETNPLLEAFGNAKTLRNNNSSRFGKYFEIQFNQNGEPDGGKITNYLLEKSRVVFQTQGERNFHIFYQFCKGASKKEKDDFGVYDPENFAYLTKGNCLDIEGVDDVEEWNLTRNAMNVIGITQKEQQNIFRLLSAILWIGNVDFKESGEKATVSDTSTLDFVANLLGVPSNLLKNALEVRVVETKHGGQRGTHYNVPLNKTQALAGRDALAKAIYDRLFTWLVERVNQAMEKQTRGRVIGVLDIYGFEVFDRNGFEQLCINYVNEKLQQIFIEFTLKMEQEEYVREGIKWEPIQYFDNKIVCDLLEGMRPPGVFAVLDDVSKSVHSQSEGADKALQQRLPSCSNPHFEMRGNAFCVKHYAGDVTYEVAGLVEKNKDTLLRDHLEVLQLTDNELLLALFPDQVDSDSKKLPTTAGFKIKTSANDLVNTLKMSTPHYIRCLKPNDLKQPDHFDHPRVMHQIKYLGLLDNVKVRRAGFAYRTLFSKFLDRYGLLSPETAYAGKIIWKGDAISGCVAIVKSNGVEPSQYQVGKTKIFIRLPETLFALEELRERYWHNMASRIKNAYKNYKEYRTTCARTLQNYWRLYKDMSSFSDFRAKNEQHFVSRKERQRISMISVRRYFGDYLDMRTQSAILNVMGPGASEQCIFSSKCQAIVHPTLRANKLSPRFLVLTQQALYLIKLKKEKNQLVHILDRRIPMSAIQSYSLSPYADNFIIVHAPEDFDAALVLDFKTELVATINRAKGSNCNITFNPKIEYHKKKGKTNTIEFVQDSVTLAKLNSKEAVFKKNTIFCPTGMPASSVPQKVRKNAKPLPPLQPRISPMKVAAAPMNFPMPVGVPDQMNTGVPRPGAAGGKKFAPVQTSGFKKPAAGQQPAMPGPGGAKPKPAGAKPMGAKPAPTSPPTSPTGAGAPGGARPLPSGGPKPAGAPMGAKPMGAKPVPAGAKPAGMKPAGAKPAGAPQGRALPTAQPAKVQFKALYDYDAVELDELTFREGDVITLTRKVDPEWWEGQLNGLIGVFPANYVEEIKR